MHEDLVRASRRLAIMTDDFLSEGDVHAMDLSDAVSEVESLVGMSSDDRPSLIAKLAGLLHRYRRETPLGHQPHMIAHLTDNVLREVAIGHPSVTIEYGSQIKTVKLSTYRFACIVCAVLGFIMGILSS